jgi:hypothetical protein
MEWLLEDLSDSHGTIDGFDKANFFPEALVDDVFNKVDAEGMNMFDGGWVEFEGFIELNRILRGYVSGQGGTQQSHTAETGGRAVDRDDTTTGESAGVGAGAGASASAGCDSGGAVSPSTNLFLSAMAVFETAGNKPIRSSNSNTGGAYREDRGAGGEGGGRKGGKEGGEGEIDEGEGEEGEQLYFFSDGDDDDNNDEDDGRNTGDTNAEATPTTATHDDPPTSPSAPSSPSSPSPSLQRTHSEGWMKVAGGRPRSRSSSHQYQGETKSAGKSQTGELLRLLPRLKSASQIRNTEAETQRQIEALEARAKDIELNSKVKERQTARYYREVMETAKKANDTYIRSMEDSKKASDDAERKALGAVRRAQEENERSQAELSRVRTALDKVKAEAEERRLDNAAREASARADLDLERAAVRIDAEAKNAAATRIARQGLSAKELELERRMMLVNSLEEKALADQKKARKAKALATRAGKKAGLRHRREGKALRVEARLQSELEAVKTELLMTKERVTLSTALQSLDIDSSDYDDDDCDGLIGSSDGQGSDGGRGALAKRYGQPPLCPPRSSPRVGPRRKTPRGMGHTHSSPSLSPIPSPRAPPVFPSFSLDDEGQSLKLVRHSCFMFVIYSVYVKRTM